MEHLKDHLRSLRPFYGRFARQADVEDTELPTRENDRVEL